LQLFCGFLYFVLELFFWILFITLRFVRSFVFLVGLLFKTAAAELFFKKPTPRFILSLTEVELPIRPLWNLFFFGFDDVQRFFVMV
jgi:hypothetical protein